MKIIHCADIHLDSPFTVSDPAEAEKRRTSLRSAFSSLVLYAKTSGCELFIISGDLFDDESITKDTSLMLCKEMSSISGCRFVIAPGNHDPYTQSSPYKLIKWPDNVYIFTKPTLEFFDFPEINTRVYGYAFTGDTMTQDPLTGFCAEDKSKINILAAHCDLDKTLSYYAPVTKYDLAECGCEYAALGHIHTGTPVEKTGGTLYAYSGCIEGRDFGETGYKGAIVGEVSKSAAELRHVRFSAKRYEKTECDVSGASCLSDCAQTISEKCASYGEDTLLRIVLTGITSTSFFADNEQIRKIVTRPCYVEIKDDTLAMLDAKNLKEDKSLAGEFFRSLEPKLLSQDPEEKKTASLALKYGLRAINKMEIKL